MNIKHVCILGGTGFVGGYLINRLHQRGVMVTVPSRSPSVGQYARLMPNARLITTDVYDRDALEQRFAGADAVINLVGILNEKGFDGSGFERAHVALTQTALDAAKAVGIKRFVQMSALAAGRGDSHYLRTKGEAEQRVRAAGQQGLATTIFRPSVIFGREDDFFNRFEQLLALAPFMPLACAEARFAPAFVEDVAQAFAMCLNDRSTFGQTYELCGPSVYTLRELVRMAGSYSGNPRPIIGLPNGLARLQAMIMERIPGKPLSTDNLKSLQIDSVCQDDGFARLGIEPAAIEMIVPDYLGATGKQRRLQRWRTSRPS